MSKEQDDPKIRPLHRQSNSRVVIGESIKTALQLNRYRLSAISDETGISKSALYNYGSDDTTIASKEKLMKIAGMLGYTYEDEWQERGRKVNKPRPSGLKEDRWIGSVVAEFKEVKHIQLFEALRDMNPQLRDMDEEELHKMSVDDMVRIAIQPELHKHLERRTQIRSSVMAEGAMRETAKENHMIPVIKEQSLLSDSEDPTESTQMYMLPPVKLRDQEGFFGLELELRDLHQEGLHIENPYHGMFKRGTVLILDKNPAKVKVKDKIVMITMDGEMHFGQLIAKEDTPIPGSDKRPCFAELDRFKIKTGLDPLYFTADKELVQSTLKEREKKDKMASASANDLLGYWFKIVNYETDPYSVRNAPF